MAKDDVMQHIFRLNLENPIELRLHQQLLNVNLDVYKSKNKYIIKKLSSGIFGERDELEQVQSETNQVKNQGSLSEAELQMLEQRITQNVLNEVLKTLLNMVVQPTGKYTLPVVQAITDKPEEDIDENVASAALGYFEE